MNVAICSSGDVFGGVERFILALAPRLNALPGHRAQAILFSKGILYDRLREQGVETTAFEQPRYDLTVVRRLARLFRDRQVHVAHTHGYKANLLCGAAAKLTGARVVKTEHGKELFRSFDRIKMAFNLGVDRLCSRWLVDRMVYVSRYSQAQYADRHHVRAEVIYNGISPPPRESCGLPAALDRSWFNLGIVGRLTRVKGHIYLLRALKHLPLPGVRLYVLGDGEMRGELESYTERSGLSGRVLFLGFRPDAEAYIRAFDAMVMPSLSEGLPYTILEAAYWGVPIIASRVGGIPEVFNDQRECLLVEPRNVWQLQQAIIKFYDNPDLRMAMGELARRKVIENFLADSMVRKYLSVYAASLDRPMTGRESRALTSP